MDMKALQLLLIRVYIGLDFSHHFAEKFGLLGRAAYDGVHHYFSGLVGSGGATLMLMLAGLCELAAFVSFTFGFMTRFAAVGTALYLLVASYMGGHFSNGFTWANAGGGWEYPLMWAFLCLSFVLTGGGRWSADYYMRKRVTSGARFLFK